MALKLSQRKHASISDTTGAGFIGMVPNNTGGTQKTRATSGTWYEAMAQAWGEALDRQASVITDLSNQINVAGNDQPSFMVQLTAESQKMSFLANNSSTSNNSVGEALQTLGKKG